MVLHWVLKAGLCLFWSLLFKNCTTRHPATLQHQWSQDSETVSPPDQLHAPFTPQDMQQQLTDSFMFGPNESSSFRSESKARRRPKSWCNCVEICKCVAKNNRFANCFHYQTSRYYFNQILTKEFTVTPATKQNEEEWCRSEPFESRLKKSLTTLKESAHFDLANGERKILLGSSPVSKRPGCKSSASKAFACQNCGKSYTWRYNLNRHLKYECGTKKKFQCGECGRKFPYKQNCDLHIKRIHHDGKIQIIA